MLFRLVWLEQFSEATSWRHATFLFRSVIFFVKPTKFLYVYLEYHSVCPLVRIGTPPPPLPQASVYPPEPKVRAYSPAGEGVGGSQFGRLEKKPSTLSTLWLNPTQVPLCVHDKAPCCSYYKSNIFFPYHIIPAI